LEKIKSAASSGFLVKILGIKEPQAIYPRIAFHAGDDPAQHEVVGIRYGAIIKNGCIRCMHSFREAGQYKHNIHKFRDSSIVPNIRECGEFFERCLQQDASCLSCGGRYIELEGREVASPIARGPATESGSRIESLYVGRFVSRESITGVRV